MRQRHMPTYEKGPVRTAIISEMGINQLMDDLQEAHYWSQNGSSLEQETAWGEYRDELRDEITRRTGA